MRWEGVLWGLLPQGSQGEAPQMEAAWGWHWVVGDLHQGVGRWVGHGAGLVTCPLMEVALTAAALGVHHLPQKQTSNAMHARGRTMVGHSLNQPT